MPNWCYNTLKFSKKDAHLILNKDNEVDFNILVPEPIAKEECSPKYYTNESTPIHRDEDKPWFNWYEWHYDYWGVKWNARTTYVDISHEQCVVEFETPWGTPDEWFCALAKADSVFELWYEVENDDDSGKLTEQDFLYDED